MWDAAEVTDKLAQIARLNADELRGWHNLLSGVYATGRNPFPGEIAAIQTRARELGLTL